MFAKAIFILTTYRRSTRQELPQCSQRTRCGPRHCQGCCKLLINGLPSQFEQQSCSEADGSAIWQEKRSLSRTGNSLESPSTSCRDTKTTCHLPKQRENITQTKPVPTELSVSTPQIKREPGFAAEQVQLQLCSSAIS